MYKKIDMVAQAGKWWTIAQMQRETALRYISINARELIDALNSEDEDDANVIAVLRLVSTAVAVANDGEDVVPKREIIDRIDYVLDAFGYNPIEDLFNELPALDGDELQELASQLDDARESAEPKYGDNVVGLIFCIAILQSNAICDTAYALATLFCDSSFDIVPEYEDFLLDF